jgi:outer membrane protein, multidrug efflux system
MSDDPCVMQAGVCRRSGVDARRRRFGRAQRCDSGSVTQGAAPRCFSSAALAAALLVVGCASPSALPTRPLAMPQALDVPATWSSTDALASSGSPALPTASLAQWWLVFGDALLTALIGEALDANTSVLSAEAALRQARAQRDIAAAGLSPTLDASASAQRGVAGGRSTGNAFKVGLDASWELDVFGASRSALQASEADARASAASLGDVQVSIAAEVALAYIALRNAQARLGVAQANLESQLETLQIAMWRLQAGLVTQLETEQARAAAEQTRAQLPALQTAIAQNRHALAVLTGRPPAALADKLGSAAPVPMPTATLALSLPADTLRQRADVRSAEQQALAALARVDQANAQRLPNFRLTGSLGLSALTVGALTNSASLLGSLLAGVSYPLFDGGAANANVRAQQAAFEQARGSHRAAVLTALKDVEDALVALRGNRERLARLEQAAQAAGNAALLARQRFAGGLVDFQTVLDTQRTQLSTQDSVASASADVSADHVRLYKALGGGWQPDSALDLALTPTRTSP